MRRFQQKKSAEFTPKIAEHLRWCFLPMLMVSRVASCFFQGGTLTKPWHLGEVEPRLEPSTPEMLQCAMQQSMIPGAGIVIVINLYMYVYIYVILYIYIQFSLYILYNMYMINLINILLYIYLYTYTWYIYIHVHIYIYIYMCTVHSILYRRVPICCATCVVHV